MEFTTGNLKHLFNIYFCATGINGLLSLFPAVLSPVMGAQICPDAIVQYYHFYFTDTWDTAQVTFLITPLCTMPINCYKEKVWNQPFSKSPSLSTVKHTVCCCHSQTMKGFGFSGASSFLWCQNISWWKDDERWKMMKDAVVNIYCSTICVVCGRSSIKQELGYAQCFQNWEISTATGDGQDINVTSYHSNN